MSRGTSLARASNEIEVGKTDEKRVAYCYNGRLIGSRIWAFD